MTLRVEDRVQGEWRIASIRGEIDMGVMPQLERELKAAASDYAHPLVLDLSDCNYVDSSGLSALMRCVDAPRRRGAPAYVVSPRESRVRRILDIVGFDRHVRILDSLDEALAYA